MSERAYLEQSLAKTELQLSALQKVVADIDNTRVQLRRAINQKAPIAILPVDVKLEIFLHAYRNVLPLVFGAVCKEWRDIAWNSPQLWDTIDLVLSQDHYKTQVILLKDWLKRSGQYPLSVCFCCDTVAVIYNRQNPGHDCLSMLFEQSYRWEHVDFHVPRNEIVNFLYEPGCLPLLRSLSLDFGMPDKWITPLDVHLLRYFAEAPLLHSANTNDSDLADIDLPWKQLEVLNYRFSRVNDFFEIMEQTQNLIHFYLDSESLHFSHPPQVDHRVRIPKLQSITVRDHETLKMVDLPSLKDLYITSRWDKLESEVLLDFVQNSLCHITTLDARASDLIGDFTTLIRYIPSLLNLRLSLEESKQGLLDHFIEALRPDCAAPLLPNLETLMYKGKTSFSCALLADVLEQRWKKGGPSSDKFGSVSQFKSVHINSTNAMPGMDDPAVDNKLAMLRSEGMDIIISASIPEPRG